MHFWRLPDNLIRLMNMTVSMHGTCLGYLFQNSHGARQVKRYIPEIYKNHLNTPLRKRTRDIMSMAVENPEPTLKDRLRELYRTYPYHLLRDKPIDLKMKNFYFERELTPLIPVRIYCLTGDSPDPAEDEIYAELNYDREKKVKFNYRGEATERFYAREMRRGELSNLLLFLWE